MLRQHGLTGTGGGSEDALLEVCWSHFFGSSHPSMFNFLCRNTRKRAAKYADGCGSKTLDGWVKKNDDGVVRWTQRDLKKLAEDLDTEEPRVSRSLGWRRVLEERRRSSMA